MPVPSRPIPTSPDDILVQLGPNRDKELPDIYLAFDHPFQRRHRKIYYYLQDLSKAGLKKTLKLENRLKIPHGSHQDALDAGFLHMENNDIIFVRGLNGRPNGQDDVAVAWGNGATLFTDKERRAVLNARDACLGPRSNRTRHLPQLVDGAMTGGTEFECSRRANPVKPNTRCYTVGNSFEGPTQIQAPCADGKVTGDEDKEAISMRTSLLKATSPCAMKALKSGPPTIIEHIRINAELINTPGLGSEDNVAFTAAQINIAPAQCANSGTTLQEAMGDFGGEHRDGKDAPGYYTNMIAISDLPEDFDPGRFFILVPGVFFTLDNFSSMTFSGLRAHGGTAPVAPPGCAPALLEWAYRFVVVMYPPNGQTAGNQRYLLGALPNHEPFFIPPEMTRAKAPRQEDRGWCSHAAYLEDGHVIATQKKQLQFTSRALYSFCLYMIAQLPAKYHAQIDMDEFLQSFSALDQNGVRRRIDKWEAGPGYRKASLIPAQAPSHLQLLWSQGEALSNLMGAAETISNAEDAVDDEEMADEAEILTEDLVSQEPHRQVLRDVWERYCTFVGGHIPYAVCKSNGMAPLDEDDGDGVERTGVDSNSDGEEEIEPPNSNNGQGGRPAGSKSAPKRKSSATDTSKKRQKVGLFPQEVHKSREEVVLWPDVTTIKTAIKQNVGTDTATASTSTADSTRPPERRKGRHLQIPVPAPESSLNLRSDSTWYKSIPSPGVFNNIDGTIRPENEPTKFLFLEHLTLESIQIELANVEESIYRVISLEDAAPSLAHSNSILHLQTAICQDPLSINSLPVIFHGLEALQQFEVCNQRTSLTMRKQHAGIMMVNYLTWFWLDVYIAGQSSNILHSSPPAESTSWISLLVSAVKENYDLRISPQTYSARRFGIELPDATYTCSASTRAPESEEAAQDRILTTILDILRNWLGYSQDEKSRLQARFIHAAVHEFGAEFLLLDQCWHVYRSVTRTFFRSIGAAHDVTSFLQPLTTAIRNHALHNATSQERKLVTQLARVIEDFFNGQVSLTPAAVHNSSTFAARLPAQLQAKAQVQAQKFRLFLEDSLRFLDSSSTSYHFPKLKAAFSKYSNQLLPFRELAPSRLRIRGHEGPFSPHIIRTTEGIFSAVVWRAITFGTKFAQKHPMVFHSAAHFDELCERVRAQGGEVVKDGAKYFCDGSAYGPHNPSRKVDLAHDYWAFLQHGSWIKMLSKKPILDFQEAYHYFTDGNFPQLGPLGGYLLVADLTYSGVVMVPTADELSVVIRKLNKGAVSGLGELCFIPPREGKGKQKGRTSLEYCTAGLCAAQELILETIPRDRHRSLFVDVVMTEHALCKFSRACARSYIS